jgi:hypothetical protein
MATVLKSRDASAIAAAIVNSVKIGSLTLFSSRFMVDTQDVGLCRECVLRLMTACPFTISDSRGDGDVESFPGIHGQGIGRRRPALRDDERRSVSVSLFLGLGRLCPAADVFRTDVRRTGLCSQSLRAGRLQSVRTRRMQFVLWAAGLLCSLWQRLFPLWNWLFVVRSRRLRERRLRRRLQRGYEPAAGQTPDTQNVHGRDPVRPDVDQRNAR